jgi:hypothetical protein
MTVRGVLANDHQPDGRTRHPDRHGNCSRHPLYVSFAAEVLSSHSGRRGQKNSRSAPVASGLRNANLINVPTETVTSTEIGIQSAKRRQRSP